MPAAADPWTPVTAYTVHFQRDDFYSSVLNHWFYCYICIKLAFFCMTLVNFGFCGLLFFYKYFVLEFIKNYFGTNLI